VNGANLTIELDTGATWSIISEETYCKLFLADRAPTLKASRAQLKTYTGEVSRILGEIKVQVQYKTEERNLNLLVIAGKGPSLLGRNWLSQIKLDWSQLNHLHTSAISASCQQILDQHKAVFEEGLGKVGGTTAKFQINLDVQPRFYKAQPVSYALQPKAEVALRKLEADDVIKPVQFSQWAAPIVPALKLDRSVHICGDYKVTLNQVAKTDMYPLPKIEDLFTSLSGGKLFSKMDLASAYLQIPLDEQSKEYTTINTHKGLYCYNRLPFGVASAPSISSVLWKISCKESTMCQST